MVRTSENGEELLLMDPTVIQLPFSNTTTTTTTTTFPGNPLDELPDKVVTPKIERVSKDGGRLAKKVEKEARKQEKIAKKQEKKEAKRIQDEEKKRKKEEEKNRKREEKRQQKELEKSLKESKNEKESKKKKKSSRKSRTQSKSKEDQKNFTEHRAITTSTTITSITTTDTKNTKENKQSFVIEPSLEEDKSSELIELQEEDNEDVNDFVGNYEFEEQQDKNSFECLTQELLIAKQNNEIEEVAELLSIETSAAAALLRHFKWNRDKLLTAYFEDQNKIMSAAGVVIPTWPTLKQTPELSVIEEDCSVCADQMTFENSFAAVCSHRFCKDCWSLYLTTKIQEGESGGICCPSRNCTIIIDQHVVKHLVSESIFQKYFNYLTQSFVDQNERVKWCPAKGCGNAITADMVKGQMVTCSCGYHFCFHCQEEAHWPSTCDQVKMWQKKIQDESETQNWISAHTQDCPKCKSFIEKNGGCNHMTCRVCSYEFCWLCLRDWKGHNDYYTCNRYQKSQKKAKKSKNKDKNKKELHRAALERYLHYYSRYLNHDRSRAFEKIREEANKKMQYLQETEATSAEVKFILEATQQLLECRLALKYSYIVGYFLPETKPTKNLFEYQQEILEKTAEQLSEALENPEDKLRVMNLTRVAETRIKNFLEAVMDDESLC